MRPKWGNLGVVAEITRKRTGGVVKGLFAILLQAPPEGLRAGEGLERLAASIDLTPYEQGVYASFGVKRFDEIVRFATRLSDSARRRLPLTPIYFLTSKE